MYKFYMLTFSLYNYYIILWSKEINHRPVRTFPNSPCRQYMPKIHNQDEHNLDRKKTNQRKWMQLIVTADARNEKT